MIKEMQVKDRAPISSDRVRDFSFKGFLLTSSRTLIMNLFKVVSLLVLSTYLNSEEYGVFGIINSWIIASFFLTDIGTNDLNIQMRDEPSQEVYQTSLFIHLFLSLLFMFLFIALSGLITSYYQLPDHAQYMIITLALMIPVLALRQVPRIKLERQLLFKEVTIAEVLESFALNIIQVSFAILGFGAWCFVYGTVAKTIIGTAVIIYFTKPIPVPKFSIKTFKKILPESWPFQASLILSSISALVLPIILGTNVELSDVGLATWSISLASFPMVLAFNFYRVLFPSLSRLSHDEDKMKKLSCEGLEISFFLFAFIFSLGACCSWGLINLFFSDKWLASLDFFAITILWSYFSTIVYLLGTIINARKLQRFRFFTELYMTVANIILCYIGVINWGVKGYFVALAIVQFIVSLYFSIKIWSYLRVKTFYRFFVGTLVGTGSYFINYTYFQNHSLLYQLFAFIISFVCFFVLLDYTFLKDIKLIYRKLRSII